MTWPMRLLERDLLPDMLVRLGIRRLLKARLLSTLDELGRMSANDLVQARYAKFRKMGNFFLG